MGKTSTTNILIETKALILKPIIGVRFYKNDNLELFLTVSLFHKKFLFIELRMIENEIIKDENILASTDELPDDYKTKDDGIVYQTSKRFVFYISETRLTTSSLYGNIRKTFFHSSKENICIYKDIKITNSIISISNGILQIFGDVTKVKYGYLINPTNFKEVFKNKKIRKLMQFL